VPDSTQHKASSPGALGALLGEQWSGEEEHLRDGAVSSEEQTPLMPGMALGQISGNSEAERGTVRRNASERNLEGREALGPARGVAWGMGQTGCNVNGTRRGQGGRGEGVRGVSAEHSSVASDSVPGSGNLGSSEGSGHSAREAAADWYGLDALGMPGVTATGGKAFPLQGPMQLPHQQCKSQHFQGEQQQWWEQRCWQGDRQQGRHQKGETEEESGGQPQAETQGQAQAQRQAQARMQGQSGEWNGSSFSQVGYARGGTGAAEGVLRRQGDAGERRWIRPGGSPGDRLAEGSTRSLNEDSGRWGSVGGSVGGSVRSVRSVGGV